MDLIEALAEAIRRLEAALAEEEWSACARLNDEELAILDRLVREAPWN